jgi:cytoskeleton-associated protein 5
VILAELHDFWKAYPSAYWRQRQAEGSADTPIRTIKTVLHTLTKLRGDEILDHTSKIQDPENSEMVPYLRKLLSNGIGKENNGNANTNGNIAPPNQNVPQVRT